MAIPDIEIKFNKTGFEKEEVMENFNNSKVKYYLWGEDVVEVIIPYKIGMSLSTEGLYNFEITGGYSSHAVIEDECTIPRVFNNMKIQCLTINEERHLMIYEFRKSEQRAIDMTENVLNEENLKAIQLAKEAKEKELEIVNTLIQEYKELTNEECKFLENAKEKLLSEIETKDKLIKNFQSVLNIQKH